MTEVCWNAETAAYYEAEYDYTPPDWLGRPERILDEHGKPPPIILNALQVRMLAAIERRDPIVAARAGWGSGKTTGIVLSLKFACTLFPGTVSMVVTDSRPRYVKVLHPAIQQWCPTWQWFARDCYWFDPQTRCKIFVVWYYRPSTRTDDQNPIEGVDVSGIAIVDECQALPSEVADKLVGRVRSGPTMTRVYVGLPVEPAWWVDAAIRARCQPLYASSEVNRRNHAEGWLEQARNDLTEEQVAAMIDGKPQGRVGQVYRQWKWTTWPEGNLVPDWWRYEDRMRGYVAIDPGARKPHALVIVEDDDPRWEGKAHGKASRPRFIIMHEVNKRHLAIDEFIGAILGIAWPRGKREQAPGPRVWLDEGVIDRAARITRSDKRSDFSDFSQAVRFAPDGTCVGGLGIYLHVEEDKAKIGTVSAGIPRVQKLMRHRGEVRLLCTHEVYAEGRKKGSDGNSWVRAIAEYRYPDGSDSSREEPLKSGIEDPLDCIRYFAVWKAWFDSPMTRATEHRRRAPAADTRRKAPQHSSRARFDPRRDRGRR